MTIREAELVLLRIVKRERDEPVTPQERSWQAGWLRRVEQEAKGEQTANLVPYRAL